MCSSKSKSLHRQPQLVSTAVVPQRRRRAKRVSRCARRGKVAGFACGRVLRRMGMFVHVARVAPRPSALRRSCVSVAGCGALVCVPRCVGVGPSPLARPRPRRRGVSVKRSPVRVTPCLSLVWCSTSRRYRLKSVPTNTPKDLWFRGVATAARVLQQTRRIAAVGFIIVIIIIYMLQQTRRIAVVGFMAVGKTTLLSQ